MDGLECSEVLCSKLEDGYRVDSELYQKKYVNLNKFAESHKHTFFAEESNTVKKGIFSISASCYSDIGVPFVRISNLKDMFISAEDLVRIPDAENSKYSDTELHEGDIILSKTGSPAASYVDIPKCNVSQDTVAIRLKHNSNIRSEFVVVYLNTKYGIAQMQKRFTGNIQMHLNLDDCKNKLIIPLFTNSLQNAIATTFLYALQLRRDSIFAYETAETKLRSVFKDESSKKVSQSRIMTLKESFGISGRLDSEYYQEKYRAYETAIISAPQGYTYIKDVFLPVKEKCQRNLSAYNYVEIGDIDIGAGCASFNTVNTNELPDNAKIMTMCGDILISTVRPNRGAVAILENDDLLVSGAFTVLREAGDYPKEVLQVLLRTSMYRDWLLRFNVGTSYPVIKDEDVLNMPIPILEDDVKQDVVTKVTESAYLRRQSKQLLEYAKQIVEMAIEQGEDAALAWLKDKVE